MLKNCKIVGVGINSEEYHKQQFERCTPEFIVSPSTLKLFSECPSRYKAGYQPPDSDAKNDGNLIDLLLLTPEQFKSRYSIIPDKYTDTGMECPQCGSVTDSKKCAKCKVDRVEIKVEKDWNFSASICAEWRTAQGGKQLVTNLELTNAETAIKRLMADETIAAFHNASQKQVQVKGEWHDKATGLIIPVQCLIDYVPKFDSEFRMSLGDLKRTRNAGLRQFQRWCYQAKYHQQAAFDLDMFDMATRKDENDRESGQGRDSWIFILSENYSPWEIGRRILSLDAIRIGRMTYQNALARYAKCLKTGVWSGYDPTEEFSRIDSEPHWEYEAMSETTEQTQLESAEDDDVAIP